MQHKRRRTVQELRYPVAKAESERTLLPEILEKEIRRKPQSRIARRVPLFFGSHSTVLSKLRMIVWERPERA